MDAWDYCVLDIETAGGNWATFPQGFELLFTGVRYRGEPATYTCQRPSLGRLADFFEEFAGVVVTYNGLGFDMPVLQRCFAETLGRELRVAHHYDLLKEIEHAAGRRISLDKVCQYTFGEQKLPWDHRQNRRVWAEEPERLIEYNRVDLELTEELYRRVLTGQLLFLGDATIRLPVPGPETAPPWSGPQGTIPR